MDGSLQLPVGNRVGLSATTSIYTALYSCDTWQSTVRHASIGVLDSRALFRPELRTAAQSTHHDTCWQGERPPAPYAIHITNSVDSRFSLQTFAEMAEPFFQPGPKERLAAFGVRQYFLFSTKVNPGNSMTGSHPISGAEPRYSSTRFTDMGGHTEWSLETWDDTRYSIILLLQVMAGMTASRASDSFLIHHTFVAVSYD